MCKVLKKKLKIFRLNENSKIFKTKNNRLIMQSKCTVCEIKKSRFVKEQKAKGFLSNLGFKVPLNKSPLLKAHSNVWDNFG